MKCPCRGCPDRTITCHGVCKKYQDWREVFDREKEWRRSQNPIYSDSCKKTMNRNAITKARGWIRRYAKDK